MNKQRVIVSRVEGCVIVSRVYNSKGYMVCLGPTRPLQVGNVEVTSHFTDMYNESLELFLQQIHIEC